MNAGAELVADIQARAIVVSGQVFGTLNADERIELGPTANVEGEITAPAFQVKDGADIPGKSRHLQGGPEARPSARVVERDARRSAAHDKNSSSLLFRPGVVVKLLIKREADPHSDRGGTNLPYRGRMTTTPFARSRICLFPPGRRGACRDAGTRRDASDGVLRIS